MEFRDLKKQYQALKLEIDEQISSVIGSAHFISGEQVRELEQKLADYVGVKHCITCANGTDAISLALMAWDIGDHDAVFVPDFTFFSSGECPALAGATPIFTDVKKDTYNMDPDKLEEAVKRVLEEGKYSPKVVVAVDLFGLPADYVAIKMICKKYGLLLLEDGAQGFGGELNGKMACSYGDISTTSFFPAKPLGCYGDGGAIFTDHDEWADLIRSYAIHGKSGENKYDNIRIGMNSRLDTIQAAILIPKLEAFRNYEIDAVNRIADFYHGILQDKVTVPVVKEGFRSSWAQYTIQLPDDVDRNRIQEEMGRLNIPTMVYYRKPMHEQGAFFGTGSAEAECPVTRELCKRVLSLPMHPYMSEDDVGHVVNNLVKYL